MPCKSNVSIMDFLGMPYWELLGVWQFAANCGTPGMTGQSGRRSHACAMWVERKAITCMGHEGEEEGPAPSSCPTDADCAVLALETVRSH